MTLTRRQLLAQLATLPVAWRHGQAAPPLPTYRCRKVRPFTVNGSLQKPVWRSIRAVPLVPATGKPQRLQPTTFRACYSDTHLFVAFTCRTQDINATYTKRDDPLYDQDVVEVFLSTEGDLHRYFEFEFSPRNVIFD